jgi:hypothetical protein
VAHFCNSSYLRDKDQEDFCLRPAQEKSSKTPSQQINQEWWYTSIISAIWEAEVGGSWSEAGPDQKFKPLSEK